MVQNEREQLRASVDSRGQRSLALILVTLGIVTGVGILMSIYFPRTISRSLGDITARLRQTALDLLVFTPRVSLVAGRPEGFEVPAARLADVAAAGIPTYSCSVAEYQNRDGQMQALVLDDGAGTRIAVEQVYTIRSTRPTSALALQLGLDLNPHGQILVTSEQLTNVPGAYAAGDATSLHDHQISAAIHEGNQAAAAANYHLYGYLERD